jgi:hypothetical protein
MLAAMVLHLTKKNCCIWVSGVCVVFLAAIGILVPSGQWGLPPWKWVIFFLIGLAFIGLTIQLFVQSKEDQSREMKEFERDQKQASIETKVTELTQLFSKGSQKSENLEETGSIQIQPPVNFNAELYFRNAHQSGLTADVEKRIRIAASQGRPLYEPEDFYAKFIGIGLISYLHDITWVLIWRSQLLMLNELNRNNGQIPLSKGKEFYDRAVTEYPENYQNYSFDQWLEFMQAQSLLIRHPSEMLEITWRGRDFLSYLGHTSRTADERKG